MKALNLAVSEDMLSKEPKKLLDSNHLQEFCPSFLPSGVTISAAGYLLVAISQESVGFSSFTVHLLRFRAIFLVTLVLIMKTENAIWQY